MKITVDKNKCIGCGACASIEPTVFRISSEDGKSEADSNACNLNHREDGCQEAASVCPVGAISIEVE
jgi:ferredoxin